MTPREDAQARIRAELDRHRPLDVSRRTLELIAEMALRYPGRQGEPAIQVVDESGAPRFMERDGQRVPMDIPALVDEIRQKHPALFEAPAGPPPEPALASPEPAAAPTPVAPPSPAEAPPVSVPPPAPAPRDWLMLRDSGGKAATAQADDAPEPEAQPEPKPRRRVTVSEAGQGLAAAVGGVRARLPAFRESLQSRAREASGAVVDRIDATRDALRERRARIVESPALQGAGPGHAAPAGPSAGVPPGPRPLTPAVAARPRLTPFLYGAALLLAGGLAYALWPDGGEPIREPAPTAAAGAPAAAGANRAEPTATGAVQPDDGRTLRGVPEVVDTVTLRLEGRVVRLFGVEWARGGQADELTNYLRNREVECRPVQGSPSYRCAVNGQDLSRVVLYNGGGRSSSEASPDLLKAEDHARDQKLGVWKR